MNCEDKNFNKDESTPSYLHHYTSIYSLYSILKNNELWLSNVATMNDRCEITEFYKRFKKSLIGDLPESKAKINALFEDVCNEIDGNFPFTMSFSEIPDDAAQWERYANQARGVRITFNIDNLAKLFSSLFFNIHKVNYGKDIRNICNGTYENLYRYFKTGHMFNENYMQFFDGSKYSYEFLRSLVNFAACFKHESFSSEKEYRLFNCSRISKQEDIDLLFPDDKNSPPLKIGFECNDLYIKKILKINLLFFFEEKKMTMEDIIEEICVAPCSLQNIGIFQDFMRSLGYNSLSQKIIISECPLRLY